MITALPSKYRAGERVPMPAKRRRFGAFRQFATDAVMSELSEGQAILSEKNTDKDQRGRTSQKLTRHEFSSGMEQ
jgi:hypothetical protein